ncbi:MAG: serine/threonine-protein kinase, partial [Polyangiaceae bacterium]
MTARQPRPYQLDAGDILDGRYHLLRDIGRGAAGVVFEARHLFTGRIVAVKMVLPETQPESVGALRARLQREGRALGSIRHPGVVDILDGGVTVDGVPYIVMDMLNGRTLEGLIASRGRLAVADAVGMALQVCDALEAVHHAGVVHRDVKPGNIVLVREPDGAERFKLVDFGVARLHESSHDKLTSAGAVVGTPVYMAPEQLLAEEVDAKSDVYSVGATLFECLSGQVPFSGNYAQMVAWIVSPKPAPSLASLSLEVPSAVAKVVDTAISKKRQDRFATALDLATALRLAMPSASPRTSLLFSEAAAPAGLAQAPVQRRRAPRTSYNTPARLVFPDGALDGRTEDISEGGVLIITRADCAPDRRGSLRFALPMDGKVVEVPVEVRWVRRAEGHNVNGLLAIGVAFASPPAAVLASIR